jgi:hypothetical protein
MKGMKKLSAPDDKNVVGRDCEDGMPTPTFI